MSETMNISQAKVAAQKAIQTLKTTLAPLRAFSTDFSSDFTPGIYTVQVPIIGAATADSTKNSYETDASNKTITKVDVALSGYQVADAPITGFDNFKASPLDIATKVFIEQDYAILKAMLTEIMGEIVAATFTTTPAYSGAASGFDLDILVDIKTACDEAGLSANERYLVLKSSYYNALMKDAKYTGSEAQLGMATAFTTGGLPNIRGFNIISSEVIPTNSENLIGFVCNPSCIGVAIRPTEVLAMEQTAGANSFASVDPEVGVPVSHYTHINTATRKLWISSEISYGWETTNASALIRLTSA